MMGSQGQVCRVLAALDIGSGTSKVLVCKALTGAGGFKLQEILFEQETEVLLQHDLEQNGGKLLSENIKEKCRQTILRYKEIAQNLGSSEIGGISTQVFRTAQNGQEFLDSLRVEHNVDIRIVSQEEEGQIGFATACALSGEPLSSKSIASWDSGGASFQLAFDGGSVVFKGPLGSSPVTAATVRLQGKAFDGRVSPNPVSSSDITNLHGFIKDVLREEVSRNQALKSRLGHSKIVAIGGETCAFNMCRLAICTLDPSLTFESKTSHGAKITRNRLLQGMQNLLGFTDAELIAAGFTTQLQPDMVIPKLCLVHTVMTLLDIQDITYYQSTGSCLGILAQRFNKHSGL